MKGRNYNLSDIQSGSSGMDALFASEPSIVSPVSAQPVAKQAAAGRVKVGSLQQLGSFQRVSADTLIHRSTQDLWALRKEGEDYFIERLFQDNGLPLKG